MTLTSSGFFMRNLASSSTWLPFFANQNSVDYPEKDLLVSQLGTVKMLEHAVLQGGIKRFVYAGSGCAIYGGTGSLLKEEFVSMHLSTPYQISKMAGELLL